MKDELRKLAHFGFWLAVGFVLFSLVSCAGMAWLLGVETTADTDAKIKAVHAVGGIFGPYGDLIATGIAAVLVGANHAFRNRSRKKALQGIKPHGVTP